MADKRTLTGRITGSNDGGVQIEGVWYNWSKFYEGDKSAPAKGVAVSVTLGKSGDKEYINGLAVVGSALPNGGGNVAPAAVEAFNGSAQSASYRSNDTNERIARQVALKAAIDFHGGNNSGEAEANVIATARIFERFLAEPYGTANVEDAA